jgi:hypothetical protein
MQGQQLLEEGINQMGDGRYTASMNSSLTVLNDFPHSLADQALFQIGRLYAHPENPNQDYEKALGSFTIILNDFPESRLRYPSQLWILFITDILDKTERIKAINNENLSLKEAVEQQKTEIVLLQKKIEAIKNADLILSLEKKIEEQKKENNQLLEQIEKLKRVDLGIEEKKEKILLQDENTEETKNGKDSGS